MRNNCFVIFEWYVILVSTLVVGIILRCFHYISLPSNDVAATATATDYDYDYDYDYDEDEPDVDVYTQLKPHVIYMKIHRLFFCSR